MVGSPQKPNTWLAGETVTGTWRCPPSPRTTAREGQLLLDFFLSKYSLDLLVLKVFFHERTVWFIGFCFVFLIDDIVLSISSWGVVFALAAVLLLLEQLVHSL